MEQQQGELRELAELLAEALVASGLGGRSRWALRTALDAARTDGIAGMLCLAVPPRPNDRMDVSFIIGPVDVITRWGAV